MTTGCIGFTCCLCSQCVHNVSTGYMGPCPQCHNLRQHTPTEAAVTYPSGHKQPIVAHRRFRPRHYHLHHALALCSALFTNGVKADDDGEATRKGCPRFETMKRWTLYPVLTLIRPPFHISAHATFFLNYLPPAVFFVGKTLQARSVVSQACT